MTRQILQHASPDSPAHAQVRANGLVVFVPKYGIEGPVYLTEKAKATQLDQTGARGQNRLRQAQAEEEWVLDEERQSVAARDGSARYTVFDKAAVAISVVEGAGHRRQLLLQLADRALLPAAEQAQA